MLLQTPKRLCRRDECQYHGDEYISLKNKNKKVDWAIVRCRRDYREHHDDDEFIISLKHQKKKDKTKVDWASTVRPEILTEIAKSLPTLETFECFGSVCRSWRAAAAACFASEFPHRKTTLEGPWLMLPGEAEKEEEDCFVISRRNILLGGTITRKIVDLPPGVTKNHDHRQYFISCKDWLLVVSGEDGDDASLVHPLSRTQIPLPSLATLRQHMIDAPYSTPDSWEQKIIHRFVLSADPFSTTDNDFFVMVICGQYYCLGFCKPGDKSWKMPKPCSGFYDDNMFYDLMYNRDDSRLYAVNYGVYLAVFDIHGQNSTMPFSLRELPYSRQADPLRTTHCNRRYVLEWKKNTLLLVYHHLDIKTDAHLETDSKRFVTSGFLVEEFNLVDGTCSVVRQLGNKSLFLGGNESFHVDCSEEGNKNIKPNCIYFAGTNYFHIPTFPRVARASSEIGMYNLADQCIEYLFCYDDDNGVIMGTEKTPPPIWFGPSF